MKSISTQYQELKEGKMNKHQFLRNARMMFPNFVTNLNSFDDSVKILKNKGLLNEGDAVKGTPDKAPSYDYPTQPAKYKKVVQEPEVDEQDGIYPATTVTDIPKEEVSKPIKSKNRPDGLEPIKDVDKKNEMKKVRIVKESKKNLTENNIKSAAKKGMSTGDYSDLDALVFGKASNIKEVGETSDVKAILNIFQNNSTLRSKIKDINTPAEFRDLLDDIINMVDPKLIQNPTGLKSAIQSALSTLTKQKKDFSTPMPSKPRTMVSWSNKPELKDRIKEMLSGILGEYEKGDESDDAPSNKQAVDQIVDKMIDSLEDEKSFKKSELEDTFDKFESDMGKRYSDDVFQDVIAKLKKKGYNLK